MKNKREYARLKKGRISSFSFQEGNQNVVLLKPLKISLRDISAGGIGILSSAYLEPKSTLSIELIWYEMSFVVIGKVRWCHLQNGNYRCGIQLIFMPETLKKSILEEEATELYTH